MGTETSALITLLIIVAVLIVADLALAIIPARIAKKKGYSAVGFYFFGLFFFLPALIVALVSADKNLQQVNTPPPLPYRSCKRFGLLTGVPSNTLLARRYCLLKARLIKTKLLPSAFFTVSSKI